MDVQKKIEKWCRDERFVRYANERMSEELGKASNHWSIRNMKNWPKLRVGRPVCSPAGNVPYLPPATRQVAEKGETTQKRHLVGVRAGRDAGALYASLFSRSSTSCRRSCWKPSCRCSTTNIYSGQTRKNDKRIWSSRIWKTRSSWWESSARLFSRGASSSACRASGRPARWSRTRRRRCTCWTATCRYWCGGPRWRKRSTWKQEPCGDVPPLLLHARA